MAETFSAEVAFARADTQKIIVVNIRPGTRVREALRQSGLGEMFPEVDLSSCPLGIFGKAVSDDHLMQPGDRLEVYRPLKRDPRDARRQLASLGLTMRDEDD